MRRVVTGRDSSGRSTVLVDGPPTAVFGISGEDADHLVIKSIPDIPGALPERQTAVAELWATANAPATREDPDLTENLESFRSVLPGTGFTWRYSKWGRGVESGFHTTETLDLIFVVSGRIELLLDDDQVVALDTGDSVVIPGLRHAWRTGDAEPVLLQFMQNLA